MQYSSNSKIRITKGWGRLKSKIRKYWRVLSKIIPVELLLTILTLVSFPNNFWKSWVITDFMAIFTLKALIFKWLPHFETTWNSKRKWLSLARITLRKLNGINKVASCWLVKLVAHSFSFVWLTFLRVVYMKLSRPTQPGWLALPW